MIKKYKDILLLVNEELFPSDRAIAQLRKIAADKNVSRPVVALPDIHDKPENDYPTGVVVGSSSYIFPEIMVSGPNCGMRMLHTPLEYDRVDTPEIDALFTQFMHSIKTQVLRGEPLSPKDMMQVLKNGAVWVTQRYDLDSAELDYIEMQGNALLKGNVGEQDILDAIPPLALNIAKYRMGLLGSGNHFLEMQKVDEIFDSFIAEVFGLKKGKLSFLVHTGSGGLGAMVSHLYSPRSFKSRELKMHAFVYLEWVKSLFNKKRRRIVKNILQHALSGKGNLFTFHEDSEEARLYVTALGCASNFAYANRTFIAHQLREIISREFKIKKVQIKTFYDASHMSIRKEKIEDQFSWIHRSGAVRAYPAGTLSSESPFYSTGQPIFLPGSMGNSTYLCVSTRKNAITFYSMGHGAGRLSNPNLKHIPRNREQLSQELLSRSVRLYKGFSRKIVTQAPTCFKNIETTVDYLQKQGIIKKVAKLVPLAVLKG